MQENQSTKQDDSINYLQNVILSLLGGLFGLAFWLGVVYFSNHVFFMTVLFVGIFAGIAARGSNFYVGSVIKAIIAGIITFILIIVGDIAETAIVNKGFYVGLDNYFQYLIEKHSADPRELFAYIFSIGFAAYLAYTEFERD